MFFSDQYIFTHIMKLAVVIMDKQDCYGINHKPFFFISFCKSLLFFNYTPRSGKVHLEPSSFASNQATSQHKQQGQT